MKSSNLFFVAILVNLIPVASVSIQIQSSDGRIVEVSFGPSDDLSFIALEAVKAANLGASLSKVKLSKILHFH